MAKVGYIRVSSISQNTDRQLAGIELDKVFEEKASGKAIQTRPVLQECLNYLREGDLFYIHSIDRLARSLRDLHELVTFLNDKKVTTIFVQENLCFSADAVDPLQILLFSVLGSFAEFERAIAKDRQIEGIAAARKRGQKFGRPKKLTPEIIQLITVELEQGMAPSEIAPRYGIGLSSVYNIRKNSQKEKEVNSI